jgi:hypothetical protein
MKAKGAACIHDQFEATFFEPIEFAAGRMVVVWFYICKFDHRKGVASSANIFIGRACPRHCFSALDTTASAKGI